MIATARPWRVGELLGGKYQIVRVLAEGGMGVVYEAHHTVVKRRFAVKFLRADLATRREILTRFRHEAESAGALESENIAAAVDFGILTDGTPYIVMEYLTGESLGSLLAREGRLPMERATDLCLQACRGIEAAHASGIIHRDLKPENLFLCRREDGTDLLKVLDFGVAKLEQLDADSAATRTGTILGTPAYMSPEQARGEKGIDHRTDVYGLAAILFEMLSGKKPHPGDSHNAILHHISTQPAVPLSSVGPDLPRELVRTVERALSSEPASRQISVEELARELVPFARRQVWPSPPEALAAALSDANTATPGQPPSGEPQSSAASAASDRRPVDGVWAPVRGRAPESRARPGARAVAAGVGLLAFLVTVGVIFRAGKDKDRKDDGRRNHDDRPQSGATSVPTLPRSAPSPGDRRLRRETQFFVPPPMTGAIQQIAGLIRRQEFQDAAPLTAMEATPQGIWLTDGTPEEVRAAIQRIMSRASPDRAVPILVANNIPFRDCAQYSAGGASSRAAYQVWIDGFASGIGNERAVVILEPDSLGIVPYNTTIDGVQEWCKPTIADAQGRKIPAPGATAAERYALLNHALDRLSAKAPHASIYLDGTHAGWLGVGEIASRLVKAGVRRAQGFFVNVANFQATPQSVQCATWISKCIQYASAGGRHEGRYGDCASQFTPGGPRPYAEWALTEWWYVENVDRAPNAPGHPSDLTPDLTHFVIDTSRNGRGPLDAGRYAAAPYHQPPDVIKGLTGGSWCNPPDAGLGLRPTADTGVPLADAYLWVKVPGASDGSCDLAGGARAWDYARYNPWGMAGDAPRHFDPLWGTVDPAPGEWFPEHALQLARNATPALDVAGPIEIASPGIPSSTGD